MVVYGSTRSKLACSICGDRPKWPVKLGNVYWRWSSSPDDWAKYKQRFCPACFKASIQPVLVWAGEHDDECCHGADEHNGTLVYTYFTLYTPKLKAGVNGSLLTCLEHLPQVRGAMTRGAENISAPGTGNGAPRAPSLDEWEDLELP